MSKLQTKILILFILMSSFPAHTFLSSAQNARWRPEQVLGNPGLAFDSAEVRLGFNLDKARIAERVLFNGPASGSVPRLTEGKSADAQGEKGTDELLPYTAGGHVLGFRKGEMFVASGDHALRVEFVNARPVSPGEEAKSRDPESSRPAAQPLGKVSYRDLWDGVTLVYENHGSGVVKSTYRIEPVGNSVSSSINQIRLRYNVPVKVDDSGDLVFSFTTGEMRESRPVAWQEIEGKRLPVEVAFHQISENEVGFKVGSLDSRYPVVIDPLLCWNTFLGGPGEDWGKAIAIDNSGNIFVAGYSAAWGTPIRPYSGYQDAFVAKLDSSGVLQWNTFLGGSSYDYGNAIAVDTSGNVYVAGYSNATWGSPVRPFAGFSDAFAAKLDSSGALQWNTFLGGSSIDYGYAIAVDTSGNVYVTGYSTATWGSPVRPFAGGDAFAAKLNGSGALQWNTFLGGSSSDEGYGIAVDTSGNVYVAGYSMATWGSPVRPYTDFRDAFVAKLNGSGALQWNTFLGGSGDDYSKGIAVDTSGNLYVAGYSWATWGSPITPFHPNADGYAAKLNGSGALQWNTFLGGSGLEYGYAIAVDSSGNLYVATDFSALKLDGNGTLQWKFSEPHALNYRGIAVDGNGNVYVTGACSSTWGSPIRPYSGSLDAWVAKIGVIQKDLLGTWDGQGVYFKNSDTGTWTLLASPADMIACGDLYGDGKDDLIGIWAGQAGVWTRNSANGAWTYLSSTARHIAAGDMNGDGRPDFLATWDGQGVYYKDSTSGAWTLMASPATLITAGDLDGDTKADLIGIWPTQSGVWVKYSLTGNWGFLGSSARDMTAGDMNGDGRVDLVGTWDGQGVFFRDSISGQWTQMASPADQITAGDLDGDGIDDLIGIWAGQAGIWVKYSQTQNWSYIGSSARDIAAGKMSGGAWSSGTNKMVTLQAPLGGFGEGPGGLSKYIDLSAEGPGGSRFVYQAEKNLIPAFAKPDIRRIPGPGEPGFRWIAQKNLWPQEAIEKKDEQKKR